MTPSGASHSDLARVAATSFFFIPRPYHPLALSIAHHAVRVTHLTAHTDTRAAFLPFFLIQFDLFAKREAEGGSFNGLQYTRYSVGSTLLLLSFSNKYKTADTFYLKGRTYRYPFFLLLDVLAEPVEAFLEATLLEDRAHLQM